MVNLVELPYRGYGNNTSFDGTLQLIAKTPEGYGYKYFGRKIELYPFATQQIHKYKLIEQIGDEVYERIFLMSKSIQPGDTWWFGEDHLVYPVQCKILRRGNAIYGRSFKYAQGILNYLKDYQDIGVNYYPIMLDAIKDLSPDRWNLYSTIIPSDDIQLINGREDTFNQFLTLNPNWKNRWTFNDANLVELYPRMTTSDVSETALTSLSQTENENTVIGTGSPYCIDADPLEHGWSMYEFLMFLNDLAVNDITIVAYCNRDKLDVSMSSRYNMSYDQDVAYDYVKESLHIAFWNMVQERFRETHWYKLIVKRTWSEELIIYIYESHEPNLVSQVMYVDMPIFSLCTLGIANK